MAGGTGTQLDPYIIQTKQELTSLNTIQPTGVAYFRLANNIDLGGEEFHGVACSRPSNGAITHFDGNNYTISNFKIIAVKNNVTIRNIGFFNFASNSTLKNITLSNADISGPNHYGAVMIQAPSTDTTFVSLTGCHIRNSTINAVSAGGFFSRAELGSTRPIIRNCSIESTTITGALCGTFMAFGNHLIEDSYDKDCTILSTTNVTGFVGVSFTGNSNSITRCYSNSELTFDFSQTTTKPNNVTIMGTTDTLKDSACIPKKITVLGPGSGNYTIYLVPTGSTLNNVHYSTCEVVGV